MVRDEFAVDVRQMALIVGAGGGYVRRMAQAVGAAAAADDGDVRQMALRLWRAAVCVR